MATAKEGASDVVIIGGDTNGLVCAGYLARRGLSVLVLERRECVGGAVVTEELHPGFRCPAVSHGVGPILPAVLRDLELERHGLQLLSPPLRLYAPEPDGPGLRLYDDPARTAAELAKRSARDGQQYTLFHECLARLGQALRPLLTLTPPGGEGLPPLGELLSLLQLGRGLRGLPQRDLFRLLRFGPMPVADLMEEWFETPLLQAALGARGIFGTLAGPYAAGTSLPLLLQAAVDGHPTWCAAMPRGGAGALSEAVRRSAEAAGARVRTCAEVQRILVRDGAVCGVALASGEELAARAVVSGCDPRRTYLRLMDPTELDPGLLLKLRSYRCAGMAAKVNLALSAPPAFTGAARDGEAARDLAGRIHLGPTLEYLERAYDAAKYGEPSERPYLDVTIPSLLDPELAPAGAHVMSIYAQFAPYQLRSGDWASRREELGDRIIATLGEYAPDLARLVIARQVLTPADLEERYGLTGGHPLHGEPTIDQFFAFRPLLGHARYRGALPGLYLCSAGTHPGGGVTGGPGHNASREILKDLR